MVAELLTAITSHVQARRDGSTADEPFAWQSREFLRHKTIGQVIKTGGWVLLSPLLTDQLTSALTFRRALSKWTTLWRTSLAESLGQYF